jgi:hypothetical protein
MPQIEDMELRKFRDSLMILVSVTEKKFHLRKHKQKMIDILHSAADELSMKD